MSGSAIRRMREKLNDFMGSPVRFLEEKNECGQPRVRFFIAALPKRSDSSRVDTCPGRALRKRTDMSELAIISQLR
jgi:hypothetical protein